MNHNQYFDENIREQFSDYTPDVHPRIWEKIAAKKDKRRPAGFWLTFFNARNLLLLSGFLLTIATGAFFLIRSYAPTPTTREKEQSGPTVEDNSAANKPSSLPHNKDLNAVNKVSDVGVSNGQNETNNLASTTDSRVQDVTVNTNIPNRVPENAAAVVNYNLHPATGPGQRRTNGWGPLSIAKPVENTGGNSETADLSLGGTLLGRLLYNAQKHASRQIPESGLKARKTPGWFLPDCPKLEDDAAGNKKYLEFYGGPDFAIRKMSDTGNSVYLQKRKESAKVSSAYSAGLRYTRVFNSGMSLRAGVNYSQINENFTFVQGNLVQITYIINVNGDTTGSYITTGTRYKTTHNRYRSIDIPVLLGYEMGNGKLHANISAGPVVNVYSWQKGEVLDTSYQPVSITTGKGATPYQFKTNAGLGFMASASIYYKLTEKLHVMAEPYFRYNFTQLNNENLTLKQKYSTVGLRVGIRLDLK